LVGLIGRELRNSANGTWLNYALPMEELRASMTRIQAGELATAQPLAQDSVGAANPTKLSALGIVLVPDILNRTPAYVDAIVAGSPAAKAGLKPDDLFVTIGGRLVQSRGLLEEELKRWEADKPLKVTVLRGDDELLEVELTPTP
jgi:S1-C subfamily serine protease